MIKKLTHLPTHPITHQQDDLFFPTLTVREHLRFHAMVRMEKDVRPHLKTVPSPTHPPTHLPTHSSKISRLLRSSISSIYPPS